MMRRTIESELKLWKNRPERKPLLLNGVRQSGKTYLLRQLFGPSFSKVHYFDLERNRAASNVFEQDSLESKDLVAKCDLILKNYDASLVIPTQIRYHQTQIQMI